MAIPVLAIMSLISYGMQAYGQFSEGQKSEEAEEYNAQIAEQEAELTREKSKLNEFRSRKQLKAFTGSQRAAFAGAGVQFTGTPLDVMQDTMANAELDIAINKFNSEQDARRFEDEAFRRRKFGKAAAQSGAVAGGSTLLQGAGEFAQKYKIGS